MLSAYYINPLLLGNYAMSQRNDLLIDNGVNTKTGIVFSLALLVLSCVVGLFIFRRYDILNKED